MFESIYHILSGDAGTTMLAVAPLVIAAGISAAASIGNAIFGSRSAAKQRREQLAALRRERDANRAWYNRRYNEDATQRADAQLMMSRVNAYNKKRSQAAAGKKAVIGGTDATLATAQQANAEAVGNALGDIVSNAEARKDNIEAQYRSNDQQLATSESNVKAAAEEAKRSNVAQAATGLVNAASSVIANSGGGTGNETTSAMTDYEKDKYAAAKTAYKAPKDDVKVPSTNFTNKEIRELNRVQGLSDDIVDSDWNGVKVVRSRYGG